MAITTLDGLVAGMLPPLYVLKHALAGDAIACPMSMLYSAGIPNAGAAPSSGMSGAALTSLAGALPFTNPGSGNTYLLGGCPSHPVVLAGFSLIDRLWDQSGIAVTTTTAQTINSATWPARDLDGSTNGRGVMVALEVSTATTNGAAISNMTISYTNSAGTSGRTGTVVLPMFPATAVKGTWCVFELEGNDVGVRSVQSITLGTSLGAGAVHLVAFRLVQSWPYQSANVSSRTNFTYGMPRLFDNSVLLFINDYGQNSAGAMSCVLNLAQG